MPSSPQPGQRRPTPSSSRVQNTTVASPSTAASVIVTPSSTVRTIVSATTAAGNDATLDTGLPGMQVGHGGGTGINCRPEPVLAQRHDLIGSGHHAIACTPFPEEICWTLAG